MIKTFFAWLGAAGALIGAGFLFVALAMPILFPTKPSEISVPATPAPEVVKAPTKRVAVKQPVKVFADTTKFKLKLPAPVVQNVDEHVIAATQVKASDRPQTVTTTIDEKTGDSQTFVKSDPYPWLALEHRGEARMSYGYRYGGVGDPLKRVGRLQLTYDVVRVKALVIGPTVQLDTDGRAFVGLGVAYRW